MKDIIETFSNEGFYIKKLDVELKPVTLVYPYESLLAFMEIYIRIIVVTFEDKEKTIATFNDDFNQTTSVVDSVIKDISTSKEHISSLTSMVSKFNNSIGTFSEMFKLHVAYSSFFMRLVFDEFKKDVRYNE